MAKPSILMGGNPEGGDQNMLANVEDIEACIRLISFMTGPTKTCPPEYFL
jgi:hypothetical protein